MSAFPSFSRTDAWVLTSIAICDNAKGGDLKDIISVGDYINHAIFNAVDLRVGIAKLLAAGYVEVIGNKFRIIGKAKEFWQSTRGRRLPSLATLASFEKYLKVEPIDSKKLRIEDPRWQYPGITDEAVHQAYQAYLRAFQDLVTDIEKGVKSKKNQGDSIGNKSTNR